MKEFSLDNLTWGPVKDWSSLTRTDYGITTNRVSQNDIYCFIANLVRDIAHKLDIPIDDFDKTFVEENFAFYSILPHIFNGASGIYIDSPAMGEIKKVLRVPILPVADSPSVNKILKDFEALNDEEKLEVLKSLGSVSIKFEIHNE